MDRICPFLALERDPHTVVAGYDAEHRCGAIEEMSPLDRAMQLELCLGPAHIRCERYLARTQAPAGGNAGAKSSAGRAPDARFVSTRLIIEPEVGWRPATLGARPLRRTRAMITGASILVVGAAGAALSTRGFGLMAAATEPSPSPTAPPTASAVASTATVQPTPPPATPTPSPSAAAAAATPRPATPTPRPTTRVYVVQPGDSLSAIAQRYGVTVQAIMAANGLADPNLVNVGQVLIIPT